MSPVSDRHATRLKYYEAIFNATNEAIIVLGARNGRIVDINDRMLEIYGYRRDEALTADIGQLSRGTAPYSQAGALEKVGRARREGPQTFAWHARKKTGSSSGPKSPSCRLNSAISTGS